jgi:hypothetical protein
VPLNGDSLCLNISLWGQFLMEKRPFKKTTPKLAPILAPQLEFC